MDWNAADLSVRRMPAIISGVDEAGYGPILGPLSIVAVSIAADDGVDWIQAIRRARTGVKDSKAVHTSGDIEPIERVALSAIQWLTGAVPETAAACFALLGETREHRADKPWMDEAEDLRLPIAASDLKPWKINGIRPAKLGGALVQPCQYNRILGGTVNKADLELLFIQKLLRAIPREQRRMATAVDRLGGRHYYGGFLQECWPQARVEITGEEPMRSSYVISDADVRHEVAFHVDGESVSPLIAMASCIAKYARELHMLLLNRYWSERRPGLKPTAGYGQDARRWIGELDGATVRQHQERLIRRGRLQELKASP